MVSISPAVSLQCFLNGVYFVSEGDCRPEKGGEVESLKCSPKFYTSNKEEGRREASLLELFAVCDLHTTY